MRRRAEEIGFSQRVRLEWFERTANLILAGADKAAINSRLQEFLQDKVSIGGDAERGNREKIITILMKVWLKVPAELEALRNDGLEMLRSVGGEKHIAVHWGMAMAIYPFWAAVAGHVGRLLKLQGTAAAVHVQRRIREQYGERETVSRAARRVLRSFHDWGVLDAANAKGVYKRGLSISLRDSKLIAWLIEASLYARSNGSAGVRDLTESPSLFPFKLEPVSAGKVVAASPRLNLIHHGLDDDLILLKNNS
jgi:hypothetical protein